MVRMSQLNSILSTINLASGGEEATVNIRHDGGVEAMKDWRVSSVQRWWKAAIQRDSQTESGVEVSGVWTTR